MKKILLATSALSMVASGAFAAGIDRSQPAYSVLFEKGNYLQFGFSSARPSVEGKHTGASAASATALGASNVTGNVAKSESFYSFAIKTQLSEQLSFGFFVGQPYGANAEYTAGVYAQAVPAFSAAPLIGRTNLKATWQSNGYEAVLKYNLNENASVYGGLRAVTSNADIAIPGQLVARAGQDAAAAGKIAPADVKAADFFASTSSETDLGFVLGAAYEVPDIALRVGVTYRSEIEHEFKAEESFSVSTGGPFTTLLSQTTKSKIKLPQSVTIDFQSGVAKDTLVFGSAKWTEWSKWQVATDGYTAATGGNITGFDNDSWSYSLGVGRKINDNFSAFASLGYEEAKGGDLNRLAPTDGMKSIGIGGSYSFDGGMKVTAGLQRAWLGGGETADGTKFENSTNTGFGMSVGFSF